MEPAPAGSAELLRARYLRQNAAWCSCKKTSSTGRSPETAAARCLAPETISRDESIVLHLAPLLKFPRPQPCAFSSLRPYSTASNIIREVFITILLRPRQMGYADIQVKECQHSLRAAFALVNAELSGISDNLSATNHNTAINRK